MIKQKRYLLVGLLICSLVLASLSTPFASHALAVDEKTQVSSDSAYFDGQECEPGQIIIIYEDNMQAKQSADMITNGNVSLEITERVGDTGQSDEDKKPEDEDSDEDDDSDQDNPSKKSDDSPNGIIGQAQVIDTDGNILVVKVDSDVTMEDYIAQVINQPGVKHVQPNYIYTIDATVDDPIANDNRDGRGWYLHTVNAFSAWDYTFGDPNIIIGIIDTGVDADHPDLAANILAYEDMADDGEIGMEDDDTADLVEWHGTMVSGFIGAVANNTQGASGLAPQCSLVVVDAFVGNSTSTSVIIEAIDYLMLSGANVINMSFGGAGTNDNALADKIQQAYDAGIVMVASAGNNSSDVET